MILEPYVGFNVKHHVNRFRCQSPSPQSMPTPLYTYTTLTYVTTNNWLTAIELCNLYFHTHSCSGATDYAGETPLDLATEGGHTEITDYIKSLPQQCKLTSIYTVWSNTATYSLYTAAVTGDSDSRTEENGPPPTKKRKCNFCYLIDS